MDHCAYIITPFTDYYSLLFSSVKTVNVDVPMELHLNVRLLFEYWNSRYNY